MLAHTSKSAYDSIRDSLGAKQRQVYDVIRRNEPVTNEQIAYLLGWEINRVTGRVNELVKMGFVAQMGHAKTKSGRNAKAWTTKAISAIDHKIKQAIDLDDIHDKPRQTAMFSLTATEQL